MSDIIKMLLQAEVDPKSIKNIKDQLDGIQKNIAPINLMIDTNLAITNIKDLNKLLSQVEKHSKPIEVKVETDKAEIAMQKFSKEFGIRLDKNLREQFKNLASNMMGEFDQSKFDDLARNIAEAYRKAMDKQARRMQVSVFGDSDDQRIYDHLKKQTLRLSDTTVDAMKNVEGFSHAMRNLMIQSKDSGSGVDVLADELERMGIKMPGNNVADFAKRITEAVQNVREFRNGLVDLGSDVPMSEIEKFTKDSLTDLVIELNRIDASSKQAKGALQSMSAAQQPLQSVSDIAANLQEEVSSLGVVTTKTFKDMNNEVYKYIDTYKNLEKGLTISDTYVKNDMGGFDFTGRIINDKSVEVTYRALQKAHDEALKLNKAFDDTIAKNHQMAKDAAWRQYFQTITDTSDAIKQLNSYYSQLEDNRSIDVIHTEALKMNKAFDEQVAKARTLKGTFAELKGEQQDASKVAKILSDAYGGLEVRGQSINKTNGQYSVTLKQSAKENLTLKGTIDQVTGALYVQNETVARARNVQLGFWEQMKIALERVPIWMGATTVYFQSAKFVRETIEEIKLLNKEMVDLEKVSSASKSELQSFFKSSPQMARELGVLTAEVINTTAEISKLGYSLPDSEFLTRLSIIGKTVGDLNNTGEAVDYITATIKGFRLETEDATGVLDYMNHTANTTSINFKAIGEGFKRMSAAMSEGNNSIQESMGMLVAGYDITRNAEMVSTALRTTSMRLRGVSEDGEDLSNLIPTLEAKFNKFGLSLKKDNDTFKSTFEILKDVSTLKITDMEKAGLLEDIAGKRNAQVIAAIIQNMQTAIDVSESFAEAQGSALIEHRKYMEGVEAAQSRVAASMSELHMKLLSDDTIISVLNLTSSLIDNITALGKWNYAIVAATGALLFFISATKKMILANEAMNISGMGSAFKSIVTNLIPATKAMFGMKSAMDATTVSASMLNVATGGIVLAIGAITLATGYAINAQKRQREEMEKSLEVFRQQQEVSNVMEDLIPIYEDLATKTNLTAEESQRLLDVKQKIKDLLPESASAIDNENLSLSEQVLILKDLNKEELENAKLRASENILKYGSDLEHYKIQLENTTKSLESMNDKLSKLQLKQAQGQELTKQETQEMEELIVYIKSFNKLKEDTSKKIEIVESSYEVLNGTVDAGVQSIGDMRDIIGNINDEFTDSSKILEKYTKDFDGLTSQIQSYYTILDELDSKEGMSAKTKQEIITKYQELLPYINNEKELRNQLITIIKKEETAQKQAYINIIMYSEDFYNAKLKGNKELVEKLGEYYNKDLENAKSLAEAKAKVEKRLITNISKQWAKFYRVSPIAGEGYVQTMGAGGMIDEFGRNMAQVLADEMRSISSLFDDIIVDFGLPDFKSINMSGIKESKDKKDNRQFLETIDAEIRAIKLKNDNLIKTRDLLEEQLKIAKDIEGMEGLNKQYEITGQIIEHNKKMMESFKVEQDLVHKRANEIRQQNKKYDTTNWFDSQGEATVSYINKYNSATKSQQEEMSKLFSQIQALKKAWMESAQEVSKIVDANKQLVIEQDKLLDQQYELARTNWIKEQNAALKERRDRLQSLQQIEDAIVQIIRKRGEEEKRILDENHKTDMDSLEKRHQERKKKYADDLDEFRKMIQAKIDALDEQYEEEDYLEQLNKEREEANRLQKEIDVLSLDDSLTARNKVIDLRKQLADQNEKIAKMQQKKERDLLKKSLQDQIKDKEKDATDKEKIEDDSYANRKKKLEEDYDNNKKFLELKYSDERVYSEARQAILDGEVKNAEGRFIKIYDAYKDFEDKFGRGMGILGGIIKKDFLDQLEKAQQAVRDLEYTSRARDDYDSDYRPRDDEWDYRDPRGDKGGSGGGSSGGKLSDMSRSDYYKYVQMKQLWEMAKASGDTKSADYAYSVNKELRKKYGITNDLYSWSQLKDIPYEQLKLKGYDRGGKIDYTGLAMVHGENNPEWMLRDFQLQKIISDSVLSTIKVAMPKIPNVMARQGVTLQIDNFIKADNITKDSIPELKNIQRNAMEDLKNLLNKNGVRPSLI